MDPPPRTMAQVMQFPVLSVQSSECIWFVGSVYDWFKAVALETAWSQQVLVDSDEHEPLAIF